jgi:hypothetical protein
MEDMYHQQIMQDSYEKNVRYANQEVAPPIQQRGYQGGYQGGYNPAQYQNINNSNGYAQSN